MYLLSKTTNKTLDQRARTTPTMSPPLAHLSHSQVTLLLLHKALQPVWPVPQSTQVAGHQDPLGGLGRGLPGQVSQGVEDFSWPRTEGWGGV